MKVIFVSLNLLVSVSAFGSVCPNLKKPFYLGTLGPPTFVATFWNPVFDHAPAFESSSKKQNTDHKMDYMIQLGRAGTMLNEEAMVLSSQLGFFVDGNLMKTAGPGPHTSAEVATWSTVIPGTPTTYVSRAAIDSWTSMTMTVGYDNGWITSMRLEYTLDLDRPMVGDSVCVLDLTP